MPHLTKLDRDKLTLLARNGNEDAVFFLGQTEQTQKRNYYRGWKILADQGDADASNRLEHERKRLRTNHEQRVAMIAAGVEEGDSMALAQRDKHKEEVRKRQQACRARKRARQPATKRKRKAATETVVLNDTDDETEGAEAGNNCEAEHVEEPDGLFVPNKCSMDDDEPLPTTAHLMRVKQEMMNDMGELHKLPPWKTRAGPASQYKTRKEEIELKLKKINAEIKQAALEAKKAALELELLHPRKARMF